MNPTTGFHFLSKKSIITGIIIRALLLCGFLSGCQPFESLPVVNTLPEGEDLIIFTSGDNQVNLFIISVDTKTIWKWDWGSTQSQSDISMRSSISWSFKKQVISFSGYNNILSSEVGYTLSPSGDVNEIQLTGIHSEHAWAPNGSQIAISYPENPSNKSHDIFIQDMNGAKLQRLISLPTSDGSPSWSAGGEEIIFDAYDFDTRTFSLYQVRVDGTELKPLATAIGENNRKPQWSPDGMKIAFLHSSGKQQPLSLWMMDYDGDNPEPIFAPSKTESESLAGGIRSFAWSPDSQRLVFASDHEGPCHKVSTMDAETISCGERIYVIDVDGTDLITLTPDPRPRHFDFAWIR